jgi:5-methylcytosine-specific restriction endonuclease McrA
VSCPPPESVYVGDRHKSAIYLQRRKQRLREQTPELSAEEQEMIRQIYEQRDRLNQEAGSIHYHVDHIIPLAKGGLHHPGNLRLITATENMQKGAIISV